MSRTINQRNNKKHKEDEKMNDLEEFKKEKLRSINSDIEYYENKLWELEQEKTLYMDN